MWFQCQECVFATNSPTQAARHSTTSGHETKEEEPTFD